MKSKLIVLIAVGGVLVCALLAISRRSSNDVPAIEEIEGLNVVNGVEFHVVTEPVWKIPKPSQETKIKFSILFKNRSKEKLAFYLGPEAIQPMLTTSDGKVIRIEGGADGTPMRRTYWSPCLDPEETYEFLYPDACLSWVNQGKELRLYLINSPMECHYFPDLSPGGHSVSVQYKHTDTHSPIQGVSAWVGEATTPPVKVEIK